MEGCNNIKMRADIKMAEFKLVCTFSLGLPPNKDFSSRLKPGAHHAIFNSPLRLLLITVDAQFSYPIVSL